ncbi:MAG: voltage-gated chloride channel protein [Verrucomicrobia bacterium]|nr:MAG: voltage-gated chloride channel protein [Verrucomicrobiota bacterium]TAE87730.1 MAG: voltage-gated chloride channel protein [Verrucomicrobiota bacterium]TAF25433.1 MAG: voltage-gated chloride channel protein [Verrucomicrobiota bacterium]TAF41220.1 MAG: voltage-gated chloride channel protein [Verrucomicrobiota bacterium]
MNAWNSTVRSVFGRWWGAGLWVLPMALMVGTAGAFFLWSLEGVTRLRFAEPRLLFLLPLVGMAVAWLYERYGGEAGRGSDLILDRIEQGGMLPRRMAPLVLVGTLATHLCGGAAGREGTALQMGAGLAALMARALRVEGDGLRLLWMTGMAAGFGAVFGTPIAAALFAVEVAVVGRPKWRALPVCWMAAWLANQTCLAWGAEHERYAIGAPATGWNPVVVGKMLLAGLCFGVVGLLFVRASRAVAAGIKVWVPRPLWRPALGGLIVIGLYFLCGRADYLGLGLWSPDPAAGSLRSFLAGDAAQPWAWAWKFAFTLATLACGFKGGEVTPLFFIGAALGNVLAGCLGLPTDWCSAAGLVAVFAATSKAPLACCLMGIELFGIAHALPLALVCGVAFACSGKAGIYASQQWRIPVCGRWRGRA